MGRIFTVGDIHGCLEKLKNMLAVIDCDPREDTLLFIGDYIDRGTDSRGVVDFVLELRGSFRKVICLLGNHEQMLLNYYDYQMDEDLYLSNGGRYTIASYGGAVGGKMEIPSRHLDFFYSLSLSHETDEYIFVHAGLLPGVSLAEQDPEDLIWIRQDFIQSSYDFGKTVVFGHTPLPEPLMEANKIGIDTGAVYGGKLTCVELPARRIYQA